MTTPCEIRSFMDVRVCAVVPVLNEEKYIAKCIDSLLSQTYPISVMVLDGGSTDSTKSILDGYGDSISVYDNPGKRVSNARNLALELIDDEITHCLEIIGHSWIEEDHVEKRVEDLKDLEKLLGKKVGAIGCITKPSGLENSVSRWIKGALSSPIGSGGGQFNQFSGRTRTKVPAFCLHNVEALRSVGGWDERFITSQDSDISMRMIAKGWELWRSDVSCVFMSNRTSVKNWWKMCHRYGFWRTKVLLKHPQRADIREFLPIVGLILIFLTEPWWWAPAIYLVTLTMIGMLYREKESPLSDTMGISLCLVILHTAFTLGLFDGLLRTGRPPSDRS